MTVNDLSLSILRVAASAADAKQAHDIVALDVSDALGITDAFLVASASNERLVNAVVDEIEEKLIEQLDLRPLRREGRSEGRWVLLDYGDVVIHVQHDEDRAFYALERLWRDSPVVDLGPASRGGTAAGPDGTGAGAPGATGPADLHGPGTPA
ncbi:Iojap-like protein [Kocuria flava]|uniref:Ribosomal silencing factor RsfS n=1 Tax=Kocuria flava TaxID=446860 RepID=A0A0U2YXY2_9MICC|nr:ribosome silencing factor [Kocuria flava]ALU40337.1 Iojap-like protein [Kocuria flava]GEO90989.1 ribosomal silencing factor RsfS [Kocuria flava]